ncbi:MAG: ABC transporter permease [Chloroflexota bacterium]
MRTLLKLTWVELKLFAREPITVIFTLALPLMFLFVMGEVFGRNPADPDVFRGVGAMDYYTPAYIGLVLAAIGVIALPAHLASYRERGMLRRLRASSVLVWSVLGSQVLVTFVIAVLCTALLFFAAMLAYDVQVPRSAILLVAAFVLSTLSFAALGVLLGAVLPTARAAQGVGILLFFAMLFLSGTAPPREVMTQTMQWVGEAMPLWHVVTLLQDPWLGFGWNTVEFLVVAGVMVAAGAISVRAFRWE